MFTLIIISIVFILVLIGMGTTSKRKTVTPTPEDIEESQSEFELEYSRQFSEELLTQAMNHYEIVKHSKTFRVSKKWYGQGITIRVSGQGFEYDHDAVVDGAQDRIGQGGSANHSWEKYGYYVKTAGWPSWAQSQIRLIKK